MCVIEDGRLIGILNKMNLYGTVYEFAGSISMIGSDFKWYQNLWCEKEGFRVPISCGAPTIKCKLDIIK